MEGVSTRKKKLLTSLALIWVRCHCPLGSAHWRSPRWPLKIKSICFRAHDSMGLRDHRPSIRGNGMGGGRGLSAVTPTSAAYSTAHEQFQTGRWRVSRATSVRVRGSVCSVPPRRWSPDGRDPSSTSCLAALDNCCSGQPSCRQGSEVSPCNFYRLKG